MNLDKFIAVFEKWRRENGASQETMAHHIGRTRNQYALIINKKIDIGKMQLSTIVQAADFLGKSIDELIGHTIETSPKCDWWLPGKRGGKK